MAKLSSEAVSRIFMVALLVMLASCGTGKVKDGPPRSGHASGSQVGDAIPRPEAKSRYGNSPVYEVFGNRYEVMESSNGFKERGVASWYGKKFHGNLTANRETYDMYAMTAAHKSLPLPTYVRVRNLRNNKSIVVRVNDRGPFVNNRIIDLSYSAARKLDMIRAGTSLVEIEAISFDDSTQDRPSRQSVPRAAVQIEQAPATNGRIFVQVGAFGSRENANRRRDLLRFGGIGTAFVVEDSSSSQTLHRVRVGPINGVEQFDLLVAELDKLGIANAYLVTE